MTIDEIEKEFLSKFATTDSITWENIVSPAFTPEQAFAFFRTHLQERDKEIEKYKIMAEDKAGGFVEMAKNCMDRLEKAEALLDKAEAVFKVMSEDGHSKHHVNNYCVNCNRNWPCEYGEAAEVLELIKAYRSGK